MDKRFQIGNLLPAFSGVSLGELESAPSMNRVDVKYLVSAAKLPEILLSLQKNYRILEISNIRHFPYESAYFDTDDFMLFQQHMTGRLKRYKVRNRRYLSTNTSFLEVKITTNQKRTVKWRIRTENQYGLQQDPRMASFLAKHLPQPLPALKQTVISNFSRLTLTDIHMNERITIDTDLSFAGTNGSSCGLPFISVIELKKERAGSRSELPAILKKFSVQPCGFSKYCYGAAMLYDLPKRNLIKSKTLLLNKIADEYNGYVFAGR